MISQILTIIGLILEFGSVLFSIRKLFWGQNKRLENNYKPNKEMIESDKKEGMIIIVSLIVGMGLQGIAVFL